MLWHNMTAAVVCTAAAQVDLTCVHYSGLDLRQQDLGKKPLATWRWVTARHGYQQHEDCAAQHGIAYSTAPHSMACDGSAGDGSLHTLKTIEKACSQVQWSMTEEISRCTVMMTAVKRVAPVCHCPAVRPVCLSARCGARAPITMTNTTADWKAELASHPTTAFRSK